MAATDETPPVSVVVPTRGRPAQLAACVGALARLRYPPARLQVVIADDGGDVPESATGPLRDRGVAAAVVRTGGSGPGAARNAAVEAAGGDLIAFTDDDCAPREDWLTVLAGAASRNPGAAVGGRVVNALGRNPFAVASQVTHDSAYAFHNDGPAGPTFLATNNLAMPAAGLRGLGGFDPAFRTSEDRDLCARWRGQGGRLLYVPTAVVEHAHRLGLGSFLGQHLGYGRGARHFHSSRAAAAGRGFRPSARFYRLLIERAVAEPGDSARPLVLSLAVAGQLASAAGFVLEAAADRRGFGRGGR